MQNTPDISEARRALLEKYLRGDISISQTARATSVAERTETEMSAPRERAVGIQTGGSRRPFFFLHGQWTGDAFYCYSLAREMGPDQPFYLLDPYKLEDLPVPPPLETIAAAHIKSMRTVQPEGPYLLGGWCNGALVAYEMARQLYAAGEKVDLLVLLDPVTLIYPLHLRLFRHAISHFGSLIRISQDKQFDLYLRLKQELKHRFNYLRSSHYRRSKDAYVSTAKVLRQDYPTIFDWLAMEYAPSSLYPGKVTIFWPSTETFRKGWRKAEKALEVEITIIPGTHITCRTDYLHILAEHLSACVSKAQGAASC